MLQDVENIVALPNEAAEAEEMLKDDSQLLQVLLPPAFCFVPHTHAYYTAAAATLNTLLLMQISAVVACHLK